MRYRVVLTPDDNATLLVTCPDLPIVVTYGEDRDAALHHAVDAIEAVLASMMDDRETIPLPSDPVDATGEFVRVPLQTAMKVQLYIAMREQDLTRADLVRRLGWHREQVDRLFRLDHATRLDQFDAAFAALGRHLRTEAVAA